MSGTYIRLPQSITGQIHSLPQTIIHNIDTILKTDEEDEGVLVEHFQYERALDNSLLSRYSVIGLGFGLMSPVLGMSTSLSLGLVNGGPLTILGAFVITGVMTWLTSLSLGEVVSKYPIELHGSVAMLAPKKIRHIAAYFTGWFMLLGNCVMNASIQYAGARLIISLVTMSQDSWISDQNLTTWTALVYAGCITFTGIFNAKFSRVLGTINTVCIYWILYAVICIDLLLLIFHHGSFRPFFNALSHFDNKLSGYESAALSFMIGGFQQSNFTLQGFSLLPALSDETKKPEKDIPNGMSQAVLLSTLCGIIYLVPILLVMPEPEEVMVDSRIMEIVLIFTKSTRSNIVAYFLVLLILGNLIFSGIGSITTSSRAIYSMSRDHGVPFYEIWSYVPPESQSQVPKYAIYLSMGMSYFMGLLPLISGSAYNSFIGAAVLCLCAASCIAIICVLLSGRRGIKGAAVKIRYRIGWFIDIIVLLWLCLVIFCMCMPPTLPVSFYTMNYTSVIFLVFVAIIAVLYFIWGKHHFQIPETETHDEQYILTNKTTTQEHSCT